MPKIAPAVSSRPTKAALEIDKLAAEVRKESALALEAELRIAELQTAARDDASSANRRRAYPFMTEVKEGSVRTCIATLDAWHSRDPGEDVSITFNSPGGSVVDGLALYDHIADMRASGTNVTTIARGGVYSMGAVLLQAGTERVIGANATMLIHELGGGLIGSYGEMQDRQEWHDLLMERLVVILAERSTLTVKQTKAKMKRKDWFLNAEQVVEFGFADRIG